MDRRRAAGALLALAACVACSTAAPTASNQTALELLESPTEGCYYNFQHYGEGDRIMTNEPCLNCTCHNRMLMCYLKVCPFTKAIGQDCTIEKRADQCCPIVTCPDVPVDLLTSTSTSSPAEYGGTGLGKVDKYGCSINGKYFPEGSKVPPTPNKPCEHCYCIRNMTTCVMQECTLHVDGCTPIYHKDVCCPVRYSCDHQEDEMLLLDDMTTTVRPTPGFLLTTTTAAVTQMSQDCVHDDQVFADGALIKTEKACEHCYCMKGDIVCVVQECGTPMENEGKNCTSLPPRQGQCCPDTYICEGDELISDVTTGIAYEDLTTLSPPRRVEGSGYRNEPDEPYTEIPAFEGSGEEQATTLDTSDMFTVHKHTPEIIDEVFAATEEPLKPIFSTIEPDKGQNTVPHDFEDNTPASPLAAKTTLSQDEVVETQSSTTESVKDSETSEGKTTISDYHPTETDNVVSKDEEVTMTTGTVQKTDIEGTMSEPEAEKETSTSFTGIQEVTTVHEYLEPSSSEASTLQNQDDALQTDISKVDETHVTKITTTEVPKDIYETEKDTKQEQDTAVTSNIDKVENIPTSTTSQAELSETTSINPVENEIDEDVSPPGRIPGEGDCLLNGITYKNNTSVPNINNCHSSCKCFSSIVKCDPIICSQPPDIMDNMNDCQPIYDTPDACCPTYVCHSRETIPPESHSQMSGTESPKPSSEKPLSGCNGDECLAHETSPELCNSNDCQVQEQVKDCENGLCVEQTEPASDKSPPQKYPEGCIGNNCLPSDDNCIDGKCQQPIITDEICSKENGCQTSEVVSCDGPNCRPDINGPKDEKPEISKPSCEGNSGCDSTKEDSVPIECGDESCRRKEQPQYENPPECLGANCETPEKLTHDVTDVTTEISKDISYKESTTEKIEESISQSPQPEVTFIDQETPKVTQEEVLTTEKQETSELSTEKSIDGTINEKVERVTEIQQSHTEPSELHVTKSESTVTEIYNQPDAEDHSFIPQEYSTQSEEQVTQSFDHITKEMSTEVPLVHDDHSISVTVEVQSSTQEIFTEPIKIPGTKENETSTETNEEFTHRYEIPTESPESHISNIPETDTSEEHTKKQETDTETPEFFTTHLDETSLEKDSITESQPQIGVTESSIPEAHDTFTDQHVYDTGKEDDIVTTVVNKNIDISSPVTIGSLIPVEQTSEGQDTKIEPPVTNKMDADTQTEEAITENPNLYTEKATFETVSEDHLMMEKDFSQKTTQGTENENVDTESTMSLIKDQQEYTALPDIDKTVTNIQGTYTTPKEAQEYMTSTIASDIHVTQPSVTEEKQETQNQEILTTERITSNPTEPSHESAATSISEIIPMKEFSTEHPEITDTTLQPATNVDEPKTTKIPEENFQDDTTQKESVTKDISDKTEEENNKLKPTSEKYVDETTISSIVLDKDQETSTKYEDEVTLGYIDETTLAPEKAATKFDKTTLPPTRLAESGTETTESSEKHTVGVNDILDKTLTTLKPFEEENVDDKTEAILTDSDEHLYTLPSAASESTEDKESVTVSTVGQKEEVPIFTKPDKPETDEKSSEEMPSEEVTELIDSGVKGDTNKEIFTSTLYPDMRETIAENVETHAPETVTQSQDEDNKLVPELQTEIPPTSLHFDKDDKNTESPMSLVTESDVHMTSPHPIKSEDDSSQIEVEKTTQNNIIVDESSEESLHSPGYHETHKPATEPMLIPESEKESFNETPSPIHHEQENKHDITSTIAAIEITTTNIPDIYQDSFTTSPVNEDVTSSIVTETVQQQAQTIKYQDDVTAVQIPTKSDSEVLHEASTTNPLIEYSEKSTVEQQEGSPRPPGIFTVVTDITIDHELNEKSTDQPLNVGQETSTQGKITETVQEDHTSIYDDNFQQEHTTIPEFVTTKYVETSDSETEKETTEYKPDKERTSTSVYEENNTTENLPNTVLSESDSDHHTTVEQEKSTAPTQILDTEKDVTTISYDTANTIKEDKIPDAHISTAGVISTESSIDEEDYRRTLSTAKETEGETLTTKKQEIPLKEYTTELPKVSKTEFIEDSDSLHRTSTDTYVKEVTTIPSADKQQEPEYVTSIPQSEEEVLLQTSGTASSEDQDLTVATESIDKHITEDQHITEKPLHTEQDLQTVLPTKDVIFKDDVTDRPTIQDDIVQIPFEETPEKISPQHEVPHESETEHLPTEAETETPSILEIGTSEPHITHTESSTETDKAVSEEMVTVVSDETVTSVPKEIETSLPIETEVTVSKETDTAISIGTESSAAMETETLDITTKIPSPVDLATETSLYKETEPSVSIEIGTETSVPKESQTSIPLKTDITVPVQTETEISVPKETDEFEPTEPTLTKVTEYSQKETETTQEITKPASISDQVKDEKFPEDAVPTSEPISSETTPYSVELQEHTIKLDDDISSDIPVDTFTTKASEIYQTERGDQPLETLDQSTQKEIHEVQTEPTIIEKVEESTTTSPQEQQTDYAMSTSVDEEIPHKTEGVTEEIPLESSVPTLLDTSPGENVPAVLTEEQRLTTIPTVSVTSEHDKVTLESATVKAPEQQDTHETIAPEDELIPTITKATTTGKTMDSTTQFPTVQDRITKPEEKPVESYPSTTGPEEHKPSVNEIQPTEEIPSPDFPPSGTSGYGQEPDYVEEDQAFGPGTCRYGGKVYVSAQQIPRDDPCDFCFCFRSDIICLQQSCPPPIQGCHEEPIQGFCCPRYECPVSMATTLNVTTTTTTTTTTLPPHFLPHAYKGAAQRRGCQIKGHTYKVGDVVKASSGPCLHCTCGGDGQMKCDPKACTPEPMLRQMIAAAVSAKRRR